jgi:hypothetical protein
MKYREMGPGEQRYVRPPRLYDVPLFQSDMRYCTSSEPFLRPTRWCDPREQEVIAMSNELGAYELLDYEFAESAYWFVKDNIHFELLPLDSAGTTLKRGTGSCFHIISLFNALCRAAGIKARYKTFAMNYDRMQRSPVDPVWDGWYNDLGGLAAEAEAEVFIDGAWVVAYPVARAEISAARGAPIVKFGEEAIGMLYDALPGTIKRLESLPFGFGGGAKMFFKLMPGSPERLSVNIQKAVALGRQVIDEAGGKEPYDQNARITWGLSTSITGLKDDDALVFEE